MKDANRTPHQDYYEKTHSSCIKRPLYNITNNNEQLDDGYLRRSKRKGLRSNPHYTGEAMNYESSIMTVHQTIVFLFKKCFQKITSKWRRKNFQMSKLGNIKIQKQPPRIRTTRCVYYFVIIHELYKPTLVIFCVDKQDQQYLKGREREAGCIHGDD